MKQQETTRSQMQSHVLHNGKGMEVRVTDYGARITNIFVPDGRGKQQDVVLGFDDLTAYKKENNLTDFGATIGRYANRIGNGLFTIDNKTTELPHNNLGHCLHGGPDGWQYQFFKIIEKNESKILLQLTDPDGHNNFPGEVKCSVTYEVTELNELKITYNATTSKPTVINLTNHSYFNLNGDANQLITNHSIQVNANQFTPINSTFLPTGEIADVEGTVFDFRTPTILEDIISRADVSQIALAHGIDHNWILSSSHAAHLESPITGICLDVYTSEPGIQIYSGNFLNESLKGKNSVFYKKHSAICLETQKFPDSPNHPEWQSHSNTILRPGEVYNTYCHYVFNAK